MVGLGIMVINSGVDPLFLCAFTTSRTLPNKKEGGRVRHRILTTLLLFSILLAFYHPSLRAVATKNILIIDIPRLTLPEITKDYPNLLRFLDHGAVGVMTTPLKEPVALDQVYFSFNSGTQVKTAEENYLLFNSAELYKEIPAGVLYHSLTGYYPGKNAVVHLGLTKLVQLNSKDITPNIGLFGELLHQKSLRTAAIGNADADLISRCGSLLLMDQKGLLDYGAIGQETVREDPRFPFGIRTNSRQILSTWQDFHSKAQVIVVTLGDLERLERFSLYLNDRQWSFYRRQVLRDYDRLLGELLHQVDDTTTLTVLFTAQPPLRNAGLGERLTPVVMKGPGFRGGLIYSASTRKPGIITCYDLPITLLNFMNVPKTRYFSGHTLHQVPGDWRYISREQRQLIQNYNVRWPLLTGYAYLLIGLVLSWMIVTAFWPKLSKIIQGLGYVYLFLITIPVVFLIEAAINPLDWLTILGWTFGLASVIWLIAFYLAHGDQLLILVTISILTVAVIIYEGFFNGLLELKSFFGYSAIAGARFYGIGNEYMGFLLGAYIVSVSILLPKIRRYQNFILWLGTGFLAVLLAHPNFGASIGGGATALIGLGVTTFLWLGRPIRLKEIAGLILAAFLLLLSVGLWDYYINSNNMTHFGQFLSVLKSQGFNTVAEIAKRKLELNISLIAYTPWTLVLIAILAFIPWLYKRPPLVVAHFIERNPEQTRGFFGLTLTAIVALLINDSGIVTVTTMYMFGIPMLLSLIFKDWAALKGGDHNGGS